MISLFLLAQATNIVMNDRSVAYYRDRTPPFVEIEWVDEPKQADIAKLLPVSSMKWLHGSVECAGVNRRGRLVRCAGAKDGPRDGLDVAVLELVKRFRAAPLPDTGKIDRIRIAFEFEYPRVNNMGDCAPDFCTITPPPPPPPGS